MKFRVFLILFIVLLSSCQSQKEGQRSSTPQQALVGGPCEGCEAVLEYGNQNLSHSDTLPDFQLYDPKIHISGKVYEKDGKTAAANVVIYLYHTNRHGIYESKGDEKGWGKKHGYIRSWIKTNKEGEYSFFTFRPAPYPNRTEPEHIHLTLKEPDKNEYYIDVIEFEDDPLLTQAKRERREQRGGSGIVNLVQEDKLWTARRDIILGKNIPNYP